MNIFFAFTLQLPLCFISILIYRTYKIRESENCDFEKANILKSKLVPLIIILTVLMILYSWQLSYLTLPS